MGLSYENKRPIVLEAKRIAYEIRDKWHQDLKEHEVTFSVLFAYNLNEDGKEKAEPPLLDGDFRELVRPSVVNLINRSDERADCQLLVDGHWFKDELPEPDRIAALDEGIAYFEIQLNKDKTIKTDGAGRPKIGIRSPDFKVQGFAAVARRHGAHCIAVQAAQRFQKEYGDDVLNAGRGLFVGAT